MGHVHIIVAAGTWDYDQLRYRRHRLTEYLHNHPFTEEVIWLCPTPHNQETEFSTLPNGIKQWCIPDLFSSKIFRFGRYIDLFYKSKLQSLIDYLKSYHGRHSIYLWYTFPGFPLLMNLFSWDKIIYDCSDLWSSPIDGKNTLPAKIRQNVISKAEDRIISGADCIYCTSDYLRDRIVNKIGKTSQVHVFENGVDYSLFANEDTEPEPVLSKPLFGPVLGYIGGIKPKLDFDLIREAAQEKKDWIFLFVGPDKTQQDSAFKTLLKEPNVIWTGSVPPTEVPKYMKIINVGMMPYQSSPYNEAVFPLKLYEFLAAGKPVVGMNLPSTKKVAQKHVYTHLENVHPSEFIYACEQFLRCENPYHEELLRKKIAKNQSWDIVFERMTYFL